MVLCAGEGNEALVRKFVEGGGGGGQRAQQTRPLHMVYARGSLPEIYGHALSGLGNVDKPRVTITTQREMSAGGGRAVWNIGGLVAETGVERSRAAQIEHAKAELRACVGWVPFDGVEFATATWRRAEGFTPDGKRPDEPVVNAMGSGGRVIAAWPTKLAFAPEMARRVEESLTTAGVRASGRAADTSGLDGFGASEVGPLPWDDLAMEWSA